MNQDITAQEESVKDLQIVLDEYPVQDGKQIYTTFAPFFQEARGLLDQARTVKVESEDQVDEMERASEIRKSLKRIRVDADKARATLKEDSLMRGRAIDGMFNFIKNEIVPVERYLEQQEKYAELLAEKKKADMKAEREKELSKYGAEVEFLNLEDMPEDVYQKMLERAKGEHAAKLEAEKKAEEERVEKERIEKLVAERTFALQEFVSVMDAPTDGKTIPERFRLDTITAEEFEDLIAGFRKKVEERKAEQEKIRLENERLRKEKEEVEAKKQAELEKQRKENEEKLKKEREEREKAQAELRAKEEAERKRKEEEERKAKEAAEAERQKSLAPDKEKLRQLAEDLQQIQLPVLSDKNAIKIGRGVQNLLGKVVTYINDNLDSL